jgi:sugar (pentulose or hexulose) kinase
LADGIGQIGRRVARGEGYLGIELGSTRIKACLIGPGGEVWATGAHDWENHYRDGFWTYDLDEVWAGLRAAYADLLRNLGERHQVTPTRYRAVGISAMMHGYLAFDQAGELLAPFRTWRNTNTGQAAAQLSELFQFNVPLRWSAAHLYQAVLDREAHVPAVDFMTTLAGYVHWRLTGEKVIGVGDASGMFPIDSGARDWDAGMADAFDGLVSGSPPPIPAKPLRAILPEVRVAGQFAGRLTAEGAARLDPSGVLEPGAPLCPPEGDAGTGMVATNAIAPRTGNTSVGTSIFAMVVLDKALARPHPELDLVTTPAGDPVAMVHCNNGASELGAWAGLFGEFAAGLSGLSGLAGRGDLAGRADPAGGGDLGGSGCLAERGDLAGRPDLDGRGDLNGRKDPAGRGDLGGRGDPAERGDLAGRGDLTGSGDRGGGIGQDVVFEVLFRAALAGEPDGGGLLAYNLLSGEPIVGLTEGRPLTVRPPSAHFTLANFMRAQLYAAFAALALGMRVLASEDVRIEAMYGHGGIFKTRGVAERLLAATIGAPVGVSASASEGGAWGIALLARYLEACEAGLGLAEFLDQIVFADAAVDFASPSAADVAGFAAFLERYEAGLAIEHAAVEALR